MDEVLGSTLQNRAQVTWLFTSFIIQVDNVIHADVACTIKQIIEILLYTVLPSRGEAILVWPVKFLSFGLYAGHFLHVLSFLAEYLASPYVCEGMSVHVVI